MARLVNFTRERRSENWRMTDYFVAEDSVSNPEEALRKAVYDYLFTKDGQWMITYSCGDFSWGDAVMSMTDECLHKYGMERLTEFRDYKFSGQPVDILVNQDEVLVCDEHLEDEDQ